MSTREVRGINDQSEAATRPAAEPKSPRAASPTARCSLPARSILLWIGIAALAAPAMAQYPTPTFPDITFATYSTTPGARDCKLDVHLPPAVFTPPYPVLVYVHGGGWSGGGRKTPSAVWQGALARGIAVVTIDYRLTSQARQFGTLEGTPTGTYISVVWPAQIHDCKAAVRWVRGNAAVYGFNAARIGVFGTSAGGHLVAAMGTMAGVTSYTRGGQTIDIEGTVGNFGTLSSQVFAVADYFGPSDILNMQLDVLNPGGSLNHDVSTSPESNLVGATAYGIGIGDVRLNVDSPAAPYPLLAANTISASPITFVRANMPPMFMAHGSNDTSVPTFQSNRLHNALQNGGNVSKLTIVQGAGHGALGAATDTATVNWLVGVLKDTLVCPRINPQPANSAACPGLTRSFSVVASGTGPFTYQWRKAGAPINPIANPSAATATLVLPNVGASAAGSYDCIVTNACGSVTSTAATLTFCIADTDNGSGAGTCDGGVGIEDLLYYLAQYQSGNARADIDNGTGTGTPDGGVGIEDLLYYLTRYDAGC